MLLLRSLSFSFKKFQSPYFIGTARSRLSQNAGAKQAGCQFHRHAEIYEAERARLAQGNDHQEPVRNLMARTGRSTHNFFPLL